MCMGVHGCAWGCMGVHGGAWVGVDGVAAWGVLAGPGVVSVCKRRRRSARVERYVVIIVLECRLYRVQSRLAWPARCWACGGS